MRYGTLVTFLDRPKETYDPEQGRYKQDPVQGTPVYCHISDLSAERVIGMIGSYHQPSILIHHRGAPKRGELCKVGAKSYRVVMRRRLRNKTTYVCEEVRV